MSEDDVVTSLARASRENSLVYLRTISRFYQEDADRAQLEVKQFYDRNADAIRAGDVPVYRDFMYRVRVMVRAIFAYIEGFSHALRQVAIWAHERGELALSQDELDRLSEAKRYNSVKDNFTLGCEYFARSLGISFRLDKSGRDWQAFGRAIDVRDGLMHPRGSRSFEFPLERILDIQRAYVWSVEVLSPIVGEAQSRVGTRRSGDS